MTRRLRVAWFSPLNIRNDAELNTSESSAAYMSDVLLPLLRDRLDIELFHAGFEKYGDLPTFNYLNAFKRAKANPFDIYFYNLEDHSRTNFVRCHLGLVPGVVYFHDYLLSTYGPEPILNSPFREVVRRFKDRSLSWPDRAGEFERKGPYAIREAAFSLVSIFSNERNLNEWMHNHEASLGDVYTNSDYRAFHLPYPAKIRERSTLRRGGEFNVAYAGTPRIEHRAHKVLQAIAKIPEVKLYWLIDSTERQQAEELLREFNLREFNLIDGRSPAAWERIVESSHAAIHTLFSVYGQTAPYLSISLAAGLPCVVTNFGAPEYLPDNVVFKVQAGETESSEIEQVLLALVNESVSLPTNLISDFANETYQPDKIADELFSIFSNSAPFLTKAGEDWQKFQVDARLDLIKESKEFLPSENVVNVNAAFENVLRPVFAEMGWST